MEVNDIVKFSDIPNGQKILSYIDGEILEEEFVKINEDAIKSSILGVHFSVDDKIINGEYIFINSNCFRTNWINH